ncbi:MAG: HEAT repeat domain-containing protein [Phycisphaerae bacterium]
MDTAGDPGNLEGEAALSATPQALRNRLAPISHEQAAFSGQDAFAVRRLIRRELGRGPEGLSLLLSVFFPESVPPLEPKTVERLLGDVRSDDPSRWRAAAVRLYEAGPKLKGRLETLLPKVRPSTRMLLWGLLWRWDRPPRPVETYRVLMADQLEDLDDPALLTSLARHVAAALAWDGRDHSLLLITVLEHLATEADAAWSEPFVPLLADLPEDDARYLVDQVGRRRPNRHFPPLLLRALRHERPAVVEAALRWTPNCWDKARREEVRQAVLAIFRGPNEDLRFEAAQPLLHNWHDPRAAAYYMAELRSPDRKRARLALRRLGIPENWGPEPYPGLLNALEPFLTADDSPLRRGATETLGAYRGEEVIRRLVRMLSDEAEPVRHEAAARLRTHRDRPVVRHVLKEEAEKTTDPALRRAIRSVLERVDAEAAPRKP